MRISLSRTILPAAFLAFAAAGWGQGLVANVPFRFHVTGADLPAGKYLVRQISTGGGPVLQLNNWQANKSVMLLAQAGIIGSAEKRPRLLFRCGEEGCSLAEVWGVKGTAASGLAFSKPHAKDQEPERTATVFLDPQRAGR
jgi:hypothetical protein